MWVQEKPFPFEQTEKEPNKFCISLLLILRFIYLIKFIIQLTYIISSQDLEIRKDTRVQAACHSLPNPISNDSD